MIIFFYQFLNLSLINKFLIKYRSSKLGSIFMTDKKDKYEKWFEKGLDILDEESPRDALEYFREGWEKGEKYQFWAEKGIGMAYLEMDNLILAIPSFEKAVKINSEDFESWENLAYCYSALNNFKYAENAYEHARKLNPDNIDCAYNYASLLLKLKNYTKAIKVLEYILKKNPKNINALKLLGTACIEEKDFVKANILFRKALDLDPENEDLWNRFGILKYYANDLEGAEQAYKKALQISPQESSILYNIGEVLFKQDKIQESVEFFEKAIINYPSSGIFWHDLAKGYDALGRKNEAAYCWLWFSRFEGDEQKRQTARNKADDLIMLEPDFLKNKPYNWFEMLDKVSIIQGNQESYNREFGELTGIINTNKDKYLKYFETNMIIKEGLLKEIPNREIWNQAVTTGDIISLRIVMARIKLEYLQNLIAPSRIVIGSSGPGLMKGICDQHNRILRDLSKELLPSLALFLMAMTQNDWKNIIQGKIKLSKDEVEKHFTTIQNLLMCYWDLNGIEEVMEMMTILNMKKST
ncbi:MAG: tetratricopeptide repeat protein [Candidatus Lokiarchaeota archaeon]|nr:tetratricopeptide repeat protein [Candidatus Lokiarchaeota archaeon]